MIVTYVNSTYDPSTFTSITLSDALTKIKDGTFKGAIDRYRALPDGKEKKETKKKLPSFSFNGTFKDKVVNNSFLESSGLFHFDIDHLDDPEADKSVISSYPGIVFLFTSPGGHGLKGAVRIDPHAVKSDADFKRVFSFFEAKFKKLGYSIDPARNDVRSLCFISHDPNLFYNPNAEIVSTRDTSVDDECISRITRILQKASNGTRHEARLKAARLAGGYIAGGLIDEEKIRDILEQLSDSIADGGVSSRTEIKTIDEFIEKGKQIPIYDIGIESQEEEIKDDELFPLIEASELTANPIKIDWLLDGILEKGSLNLLFGEPGAGKSLFALDWAFCIASGMDWHEYKINQSDVVIVAGEGYSGFCRRLKALETKYGRKSPSNLLISKVPADFLNTKNIKLLAKTILNRCSNPGLVIIDTMHRNMTGDENSSEDIARFISNIDQLLKPLGVAVLNVHHSGHGQKDRSRGSSSIRAAMDGEFSSTKDGDSIILSCHKAKDFEAFKPLQFSLKSIELDWFDDDGEQLTSVYLEHTGEAKEVRKTVKLTSRDNFILKSLNSAINCTGVEPNAEIKKKFGCFDGWINENRKVVHIDDWRDFAYKAICADNHEAERKAFKRCRDKLFEAGKIIEFDGFVWPVFDE